MTIIIKLLNNTPRIISKLNLKKSSLSIIIKKKHCVADGTCEIVADGTFQYWRDHV